jgi:hypothetical protein
MSYVSAAKYIVIYYAFKVSHLGLKTAQTAPEMTARA